MVQSEVSLTVSEHQKTAVGSSFHRGARTDRRRDPNLQVRGREVPDAQR